MLLNSLNIFAFKNYGKFANSNFETLCPWSLVLASRGFVLQVCPWLRIFFFESLDPASNVVSATPPLALTHRVTDNTSAYCTNSSAAVYHGCTEFQIQNQR